MKSTVGDSVFWWTCLLCPMLWCAVAGGQPLQDDAPAVTAADLLDPGMFPDAQFGMAVESVQQGADGQLVITTTGSRFSIDAGRGQIECVQRIGSARALARIRFAAQGGGGATKLTQQRSGSAIVSSEAGTIRVNCDSLLMISPARDVPVTVELLFTPDFHNAFRGNFNFFDPYGGVSIFEHGQNPDPSVQLASDPVRVSYAMKAGQVLWVAVSPPKPFDWQASVRDRIIMQGSSNERFMYPSDQSIARWSRRFNHLFLASELLWEHWQLSLVPRNAAEYLRVMRTAHEFGMKVLPYASPKMFLKGTVAESRARHDPAAPTAADVSGWPTGSNVKLYLEQATRLIRQFETDGLYFDEMYTGPQSLAAQYYLARSARHLVGDEGPLMYHSTTDALGDGHTGPVCPPLNAWFSFILKGEGEQDRLEPGYTRYVLSTYNTSNAIGLQITDERFCPDAQRIDLWLRRANIRFLVSELFFDTGQMEVFRRDYWPRLDAPTLKRQIEPDLLKPTGLFQQFRQSLREVSADSQ